jgi:hypothetical protein
MFANHLVPPNMCFFLRARNRTGPQKRPAKHGLFSSGCKVSSQKFDCQEKNLFPNEITMHRKAKHGAAKYSMHAVAAPCFQQGITIVGFLSPLAARPGGFVGFVASILHGSFKREIFSFCIVKVA